MLEAKFTSGGSLRIGSNYDQVAKFLSRRVLSGFEVISLLLVAACAQATLTPPAVETTAGVVSVTPTPEEVLILLPSPAEVRDAKVYAADQGIGLDEALRRLRQQHAIGGLGAKLAGNERDTFAGLWIQHQPEFRVIVQFTRDGEKTLRPYIENEPWAGIIEVRTASATLAELGYIRSETRRALDKLDFGVRLKSNVIENRVEVHVTDRTWFEGVLREADIQLPDEVVLVVVEGLSVKDINIDAASPVPGVAFPRQKPVEGERASMTALAMGDLVLVEGCLRIGSADGNLLVWPPDFTLKAENGVLEILDGTGQVVARVGEEVRMGGGEVNYVEQLGEYVRRQLPPNCPGPYWIVGAGVGLTTK